MRRHIIRPFVGVPEQRGAGRSMKRSNIRVHLRIGVFAQHQRRAGVVREHLGDAGGYVRLGRIVSKLLRYQMAPAPAGGCPETPLKHCGAALLPMPWK